MSYKNADLPGFVPGIHYLARKYQTMRKIRGDGNCFYRAFLFGYLDILVRQHESGDVELVAKSEKERERIVSIAQNSLMELVEVGYSEFTIETFHEVVVHSHVVFVGHPLMECVVVAGICGVVDHIV